ncbi:MAG: tRNA pseudouridine(38-40) synthase TruA [Nitrospirota bacterium]
MRKIKLLIEYDGSAYHGWQIQKREPTIQSVLEGAVRKVAGEPSAVIGAGRTDAGVHALGQVAAFTTSSELPPDVIKKALNAVLPPDIRILNASDADAGFRPRDDALRKRYYYIIANQRASSAFLHRHVWLVRQPLDMKAMTTAGAAVVGTHDFSSFMGTGSGIKNPVRQIFSLDISQLRQIDFMTAEFTGDFIKISIEATGFLRHMVRNIVGTLVEVGRGRIPAESLADIMARRDRKYAGPTAPANALFLERIIY